MIITLQGYVHEYDWLMPYMLGALGLVFLYVFFRIYENWYANKKDTLLYKQLWVFKRLSQQQKTILNTNFHFYILLNSKEQRVFEHRVSHFIDTKEFVGREGFVITEEVKLLVAALGCMLTFGRKHYDYPLIDYVLIYPEAFYSTLNDAYHKGEFNPMQRMLVLSWEDFQEGYRITDDNINLGVHEFMHALQLDAKQSNDVDALRFERQYQKILRRLKDKTLKDHLNAVHYFRAYAFTNEFEFMAVLAEYFIESPKDFKSKFPQLYQYVRTLFNFDFAGY